jgi:hypothetical protein
VSTLDLCQAGAHHGCLDGGATLDARARFVELALGQQAPELGLERRRVDPMRGEEPGALDHDGEADDAEHDEKPQHPFGSEERKCKEVFCNVHWGLCPPEPGPVGLMENAQSSSVFKARRAFKRWTA